jgi:hypothetical protein
MRKAKGILRYTPRKLGRNCAGRVVGYIVWRIETEESQKKSDAESMLVSFGWWCVCAVLDIKGISAMVGGVGMYVDRL